MPTEQQGERVGKQPRRLLTVPAIEALRPGKTLSGRLDRAGLTGSLLVKAGERRKTFYLRYRNAHDGDKTIALGVFSKRGGGSGITLAQAMELAVNKAREVAETPDYSVQRELRQQDEVRARREELARRQQASAKNLESLLSAYVSHLQQQGKSSARDVANLFKLHVPNDLKAKPAAEVEAVEIAAVLRALTQPGANGQAAKRRTAGKLRSYLRAAFEMAMRAHVDPSAPAAALGFNLRTNPARDVPAESGVNALDRVMSEEELQQYMRRLDELPGVASDVLWLCLLLGGQRPAQVARLKVEHVGADMVTVFDSKGKRRQPRAHVLPLTTAVHDLIARRLAAATAQGTALLFSHDGRVPVRLETLSAHANRIAKEGPAPAGGRYQLRDVRRTCETQLARLGVGAELRAQLLSHGLGGVQARHYDRHDYMQQKRAILEAWQRWLDDVRAGRSPSAGSNVIAMRPAA